MQPCTRTRCSCFIDEAVLRDIIAPFFESLQDFFTSSQVLASSIKTHLKQVFDAAASHASSARTLELPSSIGGLPLPELYVEGFDSEQIWGELQLQHGALLSGLQKKLKKIESLASKAAAEDAAAAPQSEDGESDNDDDHQEDDDDGDDELEGDDAGNVENSEDDEDGNVAEESDADAADDEDAGGDDDAASDGASSADMEEFLDEAEHKYSSGGRRIGSNSKGSDDDDEDAEDEEEEGSDSDDEDDEEDFDITAPIPASDDDADDNGSGAAASSKKIATTSSTSSSSKSARLASLRQRGMSGREYFFGTDGDGQDDSNSDNDDGDMKDDALEDDEEGSDDDDSGPLDRDAERARRRMEAFDDDGDDDDEEGEEEEEGDDSDGDGGTRSGSRKAILEEGGGEDDHDEEEGSDGGAKPLSRHAREKARLADAISQLESEALGEKAWTMKGEVGARQRPENSLLAATLDTEQAVKLAPQITVETTAALEDVIRRRIADGAFDDPLPYIPPAALPDPSSSAAALSTDKSKEGLGELYAKQYQADVLGARPQEEAVAKAEAEAGALLKALFTKLDALTNFAFTPKPAPPPEMAVRAADVPAVALEEALPSAVSAASARAPEEVYAGSSSAAAAADAGNGGAIARGGVLRSSGELSGSQRAALRRAGKASRRKAKAAEAEARKREALAKGADAAGGGLTRQAALAQIARAHNVTVAPGAAAGAEGKAPGGKGRQGGGKRGREKEGGGGGGASNEANESGAAASAGVSSAVSHRNSSAFFAALQAEAQRKIAEATGGKGSGAKAAGGGGSGEPAAKKQKVTASKAVGFKM